jgi:kinesin family member 3B
LTATHLSNGKETVFVLPDPRPYRDCQCLLRRTMSRNDECVQVIVRCRPLFGKELAEGRQRIVDMDTSRGEVVLKNPKASHPSEAERKFTFDRIFDWECTQREVYDGAAARIVDAAIEGYNGTVFCYGQTGTGKTHTMEGKDEPPELRGIIPSAFNHVFDAIDGSEGRNYLIRASFLEIYNENVRDLLGKDQSRTCDLKEDPDKGVYVKDLTSFVVKGVGEINNVLKVGKKNRSVGATLMNADSSRSHSIFTITVECSQRRAGDPSDAEPHITVGKLNLVDLAGSERQAKTGSTGDRLKEATKINLSLSALGNVISALVDGKSSHIPYRDSKLTRLLQDSLGGNTKTVMIANLGPADYNFDETMSTLRYANRAKNIKNKPTINEDPKDAMLREFQEEIARLKAQLGDGYDPNARADDRSFDGEPEFIEKTVVVEVDPDEDQVAAIKAQVQAEMAERVKFAASEADLERIQRQAEEKAQAEMQKVLDARDHTEEEKARIRQAMEENAMDLDAQMSVAQSDRRRKEELEKRLKEMESKLLHGVDDLELRNKMLEEAAAKGQRDIEDRERAKAEREREIEKLEEAKLLKEEKFASKKEEAADKTRKIKKMFGKYQTAKADLEEHAAAIGREKDDMMDSIRLLRRQMKLKDAIVEAFIPPEVAEKVTARAVWEDDEEQWALERLASGAASENRHPPRPVSATPGCNRPTTDHARVAAALGDLNPRYKSENILNLTLDVPDRTTFDWDPNDPGATDSVQAVLDIAFSDGAARALKGSETSETRASRGGGGERPGHAATGGTAVRASRPSSARRYR